MTGPTTLREYSRRPTSTIDEPVLFRGYARPDRVEPCVCGGWIRVPRTASSDEIREAVAAHNSSAAHRDGMRR